MQYSISTQAHSRKLTTKKEYSRVTFERVEGTINDLCNHIAEGRLITGIYNGETFRNCKGQRSYNTFQNTPFIAFDIDHDARNMGEYLQGLQVQPTIAYNTFSSTDQNNRYRLLYVFDEPITTKQQYYAIYDALQERNGMGNLDNHQRSCVQLVWGTDGRKQTIVNNGIMHHLKDYDTTTAEDRKKQPRQRRENKPVEWSDEELKADVHTLSLSHIVRKYSSSYEVAQSTYIEWKDGELWRSVENTDYAEITHLWQWYEDEQTGRKHATIKKVENGHNRRKCLYVWAVLRKQINGDIVTFEHLLYGVLSDLLCFIDNTDDDDKITVDECITIAWNAFNAETTIQNKRKYKVNRKEAAAQGMTVKQAVCKINAQRRRTTKKEKYNEYMKYYNPTMTDKQNIERLEQNGVKKPSLKTYRRFRNAFNLNGGGGQNH